MAAPLLEALVLDRFAEASLQEQLWLGLKRLIQRGTLRPGRRVPSSRSLADDLSVSRNTVMATYDRLIGEGYFESRPRSGVFVSASLASVPRHSDRPRVHPAPDVGDDEPLLDPLPFRPCQPDVRLFPLALWNRLRARRLRTDGTRLLQYQSNLALGLPELRRSLASYLRDSRGVQCAWRQVAITSGSQQALFLLAQLLVRPGSTVVMEDPGYAGARQAWLQRGAALEPVAIDEQGLASPTALDDLKPALIYVTPSRQFPTGACLPVSRRLEWLAYARRRATWIVEDDYDSEFRYGRPPTPSLHSFDTAGRVIYVGSMSKVLFPSLRIGYVVLPHALVEPFGALRSVVDDHGPLVDQAVLAAFIDSGAFYTHIRRCRRHYAERQQVFLESARRAGLPLRFSQTDGGMNLLGRLPAGVDDVRLSRRLRTRDFDVPPLAAYAFRPQPPGLVFGYTAFEPRTIRHEVQRLSRLLGTRVERRGGRPRIDCAP